MGDEAAGAAGELTQAESELVQAESELVRAERVGLADGRAILIRRVTPQDSPLLAEGFARLSEESRRLRFLTPKPGLSRAELRYFTNVDGRDHEAIGAIDPATSTGVGIARFVRDQHDPTRAEVAVTVADEWQHHGVGALLLTRLSQRALAQGIVTFTALVSADNRSMRELLSRLDGEVHATGIANGTVQYEVELATRGLNEQLRALLRYAATGQLRTPPALWRELRSLLPLQLRSRGQDPGARAEQHGPGR